jgi:rhamnose transport system ATP-binding protein
MKTTVPHGLLEAKEHRSAHENTDEQIRTMPDYLEINHLCKSFGATRAVSDVSFTLHLGEVLALIGENGAGKSTVVKMLTGIHAPDAGSIRLEGQPVTIHSPQDAWRKGITAIHQETVMFDELSVAENLFVGRHPTRKIFGMVDWKKLLEDARHVLERIDARIDPETPLKELSVAQKHLVQIARALSQNAKLVIMDEPTAALSRAEIEDLYRVVRQLRAEGKAVLLITHKFDEVFALSDRYVVLRDGEKVGEGRIEDTTSDDLIRLMAGREVGQIFPKAAVTPGEVVLEVRDFTHPTEFDHVSFSVHKGEILGFYGLVGAGRSEVMQAVFGLNPQARGSVLMHGKPVRINSPADAVRHGLVYVPEDRQIAGVILPLSILSNITLASVPRLGWFLSRAQEEAVAMPLTSRLSLRAAHLDQAVSELSGGNQQKVVLSKWLATNPMAIILDEPTKGIDVGAKAAVHGFMSELVERGLAVVLISSELPEIMHMSDRIIVMREGRMVAEFDAKAVTAEEIVSRAAGVTETPARGVAA